MTIDEYRRGIPTHQDKGKTIGMLCETKEQCITDDDGVTLPDKLANMQADILEETKEYSDAAYANSNLYTDTKIAELINGAPGTLDTLEKIANAMEENADVVEALEESIGSKVDQAEYDGHANNKTIHTTADEKTTWNDANAKKHEHGNKSVIDGITAEDVTNWNKAHSGIGKDADGNDIAGTYATSKSVEQAISSITSGGTAAGNAASLGGQTATQWQTKIDNIQTTSRATLSTAGWYRVAEYAGGDTKGTDSNSCVLSIKQRHGSGNGESHVLRLMSVSAGNQNIVSIASKCRSNNASDRTVTKARYAYDSSKAYLEIYYPQSVSNIISFTVSDGTDGRGQWKAITPTLTEETVSGVTVTTTYDIPANASPVNSEDLANANYPVGAVGTERFIAYPLDGNFDSVANLTGQIRITLPQTWGNTRITFKVGIMSLTNGKSAEYLISGYLSSTNSNWSMYDAICNMENAYPVSFAHDGDKCVVCIGEVTTNWSRVKVQIFDIMLGHYYYGYDRWIKGWNIDIVADNSDLTVSATVENPYMLKDYLDKRTGGEINGDVTVKSASATARALAIQNSLRKITHYIDANGVYHLLDVTNGGKAIINSAKDGTVTYAGGEINGDVTIASANAVARRLMVKNSKRRIDLEVGQDGVGYLFDSTNGKAIIHSASDGTNTFNGVASGNLPLDGGGTVTGNVRVNSENVAPFNIDNIGSNPSTLLGFLNNGIVKGYIGYADETPVVYSSNNGNRPLLHSGNYTDYAIAKNGGGTVTCNNFADFVVKRNSADPINAVGIMFANNNGNLGMIGYKNGQLCNLNTDGTVANAILHDGNSAKCVVVDTDPGVGASVSYADGTLIFVKE